jgi:hypothetical protein
MKTSVRRTLRDVEFHIHHISKMANKKTLGYRVYVLNEIQNGKRHTFIKVITILLTTCVSDGNTNLGITLLFVSLSNSISIFAINKHRINEQPILWYTKFLKI